MNMHMLMLILLLDQQWAWQYGIDGPNLAADVVVVEGGG